MKPSTALVALVIACALIVAGCGDTKENQMKKIDKVAAQARTDIDALAAMIGTDPEIRQNDIGACIPGRDDSGKDLIYILHVKVKPGTLARLRGEIADNLQAKGWTPHPGPGDEEISFTKGTTTMGARVWEDIHLAAVSGSGGCVK